MNQVVIDNTLLAVSLVIAIAVTKKLNRRKTGFVFSTLLLFPPILVFLNTWAHTVAVMIVNTRRYMDGTFQYTFIVYSHILFGIAFGLLSGLLIHFTKKYVSGYTSCKLQLYRLNLLLAVMFLPVIPLNPIGALPVLAAIFSSLILLYNPYRNTSTMHDRPTSLHKAKRQNAFDM